jgi:DNA-binding LytR/AlgR family response regulator
MVDKHNFIYTENDIFETSLKLHEIEEIFPNTGFLRNSKSQIVNIAKIQSLCPDFGGRLDLTLKNGGIDLSIYHFGRFIFIH